MSSTLYINEQGDHLYLRRDIKTGEMILHRVGGPAVIRVDGTKEWHIDGVFKKREKG